MYAVKEGKVMINGRKVRVYGRAVLEKDTALNAVAGTTGYRGKGREAGGRTYIKIDCCCGDFHFDPIVDEDGIVTGIEIACCGDDALDAVAKALRFMKETIDDQRFETNG